ncbi:MAG TPA: DUF2505 family protein [Polyangiales bacterium]
MTQELSARQHFDVSVDTYWQELCFSLEYQRRMYCEALGCNEMVVLQNDGDREHGLKRRLRFIKPIDAPAAITKLFGTHVTIEEHSEFDPREQCWSYRMVPSIMADRIDIRGRVQAVAHEGGTEQRSVNTVTCRLFGLGGIIEPFVMRSTEEGQADKTRFTQRYIIEQKLR